MSRLKFANLLLLICLLGACSLFQPFVDRRREAGAPTPERLYVGKSTPENPAVCYNKLWTDYEEVKKLADDECVKQKTGTHAEPIEQTTFTCRLLIPNHLYFKCVK